MKEIEEKEQYNKALERAKQLLNTSAAYDRFTIEAIFPELKESYNERIKKAIIEFFELQDDNTTYSFISKKDILTYLKKQDNQDDDTNILQRFSFYSYKDEPNVLYLAGVFVNEECRNKGIGTKILKVADEVAKNLNCHNIRLKTKKDSSAEKLYRENEYNTLQEEGDDVWLEKQGEKNINHKTPFVKFICKKDWCGIGEYCCGKIYDGYPCENEQKGYDVYDDNHVPTFCDEDFINEHFNIVTEKQGEYSTKPVVFSEQKPVDQKPWFHEDQWIVNHNTVYHIDKISGNNLILSTVGGTTLAYHVNYVLSSETAHPWTLQDAKPGDILMSETGNPFIYAHNYVCNHTTYTKYLTAYCGITDEGFKISDKTEIWTNDNVEPATREQQDLLFKKMREEGYGWDERTKELKKIYEIDDEEYNGEDYGSDGLYHALDILERTLGTVTGYQSDDGIIDHKCAITAVRKLYEQKPSRWSEEDEYQINTILHSLDLKRELYKKEGNKVEEERYSGQYNWLKSLKDRVQPRPKQEWSEEDKVKLKD